MAGRAWNLSDDQLRRELTRLGKDVGPITDSTRELYKRQLKRSREEEERGAVKRRRREGGSSYDDSVQQIRRHGVPKASSVSRGRDRPGNPMRHSKPAIKLTASMLPAQDRQGRQLSRSSPVPNVENPYAVKFVSFSDEPMSPNEQPGGIMAAMSNAVQKVGKGIQKVVSHIQEVVTPTKESSSPRSNRRFSFSPSRRQAPSSSRSKFPSPHRQGVCLESVEVGREVEICDESDSEDVHMRTELPPVVPSAPPPPDYSLAVARYDWELSPADVQICTRPDGSQWKLGKGGFGEVFKGVKDGVDEVAVKVIRLHGTSAIEQFKREIDMISKLRHRHILQFYGACVQPTCLYMVTELMQSDLFTVLRKDIRYLWTGLYGKSVLIGIASGLNYLHSRRPPIVHRDIKSPNILLMDGIAKIGDVGVARTKAQSDMTAQKGFTIAWAAPEVVYRRRATEKIDIWSFGIILWEVMTGKMPGPGELTLSPATSADIRNLYTSCTNENPSRRPSASDILIVLRTLP